MRIVPDTQARIPPVSVIGGKAHGLRRLKQMEEGLGALFHTHFDQLVVPRFFVIPV